MIDGAGESPSLLHDRPERWPVVSSRICYDTHAVVAVRRDRIRAAGGGSEFDRDIVVHPGAVAVVALDDHDRMLLVTQYRHAVGHRLVEAPAGLLDVAGEPYLDAAARELYEEGHVRARDWRVLLDVFTSPGMTDEAIRIYLARDLELVHEDERHVGEHEEADMSVHWSPLADVVGAVLAGQVHNGILCVAALAAWAAGGTGWGGGGFDRLRLADAPWPSRQPLDSGEA